MSWLFTRPEGIDEFVNVRAIMMEDVQSYSPFVETYTDEKLPWATTQVSFAMLLYIGVEIPNISDDQSILNGKYRGDW